MSQTYKPSYKLNLSNLLEQSLLIIWNSDQTSQFLCVFFPINSCVLSHFSWLLSLRIWSNPIIFHWWHLEYFLTYWLKCLSGFGFWTLADSALDWRENVTLQTFCDSTIYWDLGCLVKNLGGFDGFFVVVVAVLHLVEILLI